MHLFWGITTRTTLNIEDALLVQAQRISGLTEKTAEIAAKGLLNVCGRRCLTWLFDCGIHGTAGLCALAHGMHPPKRA